MPKIIRNLILAFMLCTPPVALAQKTSRSVVKCVVVEIDGSMDSYLPPKIGDTVLIDTKLERLERNILFQSENQIPSLNDLIRQPSKNEWSTYRSDYTTPDGDVMSTILWIGKLSDERIPGIIQKLHRQKHDGYWTLSEVKLQCQLL